MYLHVKENPWQKYCRIMALGHTDRADSEKFKLISQLEFIKSLLPETQRAILGESFVSMDNEAIERRLGEIADIWGEMVCVNRTFFDGEVTELAIIAAKKCLAEAENNDLQYNEMAIDAIIGATNTGPGYPSLADYVKAGLGLRNDSMCFDVSEACVAGVTAIFQAWSLISSGACRQVLVVVAEKATTLTNKDNWQGSNLFGDGAFAVLLGASDNLEDESFDYFEFNSLPHDGNLKHIQKTKTGFIQDGKRVHIFVIRDVVNVLATCLPKTGYDLADIKHLVFHQPSNKTISSLQDRLMALWPKYSGMFHRSQDMGNISSASFGHLLSTRFHEGIIKKGEPILVCAFGAGLSLGIMVLKL